MEDEQQGKERAEYGAQMLNGLSEKLTNRFGAGWSVETLKKCRFFFKTYCNSSIGSTVSTKFVADFEKPTIGILLCKDKDDALVELTLPVDANVYATAYQLYLPDKRVLKSKMKEWIEEYEERHEE